MARKRQVVVSRRSLGIALFVGLIIQYILPQVKLGGLYWISTLIYLVVAIYLVLF